MTLPVNVAIAGALGRMGRALCELAESDPNLNIAARVVAPDETGTHLSDLDPKSVRVLVDFTHREATQAHARWCAKHGVAWVLGTTGLSAEDRQAVRDAAQRTVVFQAHNYSLGVAILVDLVARAAKTLGLDADVEIVEAHHHHKRDAPSGTALTLAQAVADARGQDLQAVRRDGRSGLVGERPRGEIGMHAVRLGDVVGEHEVAFAWTHERLVLRHDARDRKVFAQGALRAASWCAGQEPGLYGMADLLAR